MRKVTTATMIRNATASFRSEPPEPSGVGNEPPGVIEPPGVNELSQNPGGDTPQPSQTSELRKGGVIPPVANLALEPLKRLLIQQL